MIGSAANAGRYRDGVEDVHRREDDQVDPMSTLAKMLTGPIHFGAGCGPTGSGHGHGPLGVSGPGIGFASGPGISSPGPNSTRGTAIRFVPCRSGSDQVQPSVK